MGFRLGLSSILLRLHLKYFFNIQGYTGSAGVALVTATKAGLWSDSRYTIRAKQELDLRYWFFMEQGDLIS